MIMADLHETVQRWRRQCDELCLEYADLATQLKSIQRDLPTPGELLDGMNGADFEPTLKLLGEIEGKAYRMRMVLGQISTYPDEFRLDRPFTRG